MDENVFASETHTPKEEVILFSLAQTKLKLDSNEITIKIPNMLKVPVS